MKKNEAIFHEIEWASNKNFRVWVYPGDRIEVHTHALPGGDLKDVKVFRLGDEAEYDSYNLRYTGLVKSITAKNVIVEPRYGRSTKRLDFRNFAWRNHDFDSAQVARQNYETSMYI